jgi:hypothetical protein
MCLSVVYRGREKKEALAKLPERFYVWKVMRKIRNGFQAPHQYIRYHGGKLKFKTNMIHRFGSMAYRGGGHFWRNRKRADRSAENLGGVLARCYAKKSDITSIGTQSGNTVIVLKKATFPKWVGEAG